MDADDPRHGEPRGYYAHHRAGQEACEPCKRAVARAENLRQIRLSRGGVGRVPTIGVRRRLQALVALGYSYVAIGRELGRTEKAVGLLLRTSRDYSHLDTDLRVRAVYARLSETVPVGTTRYEKYAITQARNIARRNGWPPPSAWLNIDDPNEQPDPGYQPKRFTSAELVAEWDHLRRAGESIEQAAVALGVTVGAIEKAVERVRKVAA